MLIITCNPSSPPLFFSSIAKFWDIVTFGRVKIWWKTWNKVPEFGSGFFSHICGNTDFQDEKSTSPVCSPIQKVLVGQLSQFYKKREQSNISFLSSEEIFSEDSFVKKFPGKF
jgi:hypothetical protein